MVWPVAALAFILAFSMPEVIGESGFLWVIAKILPTIFLALTFTISASERYNKNAE